MTAVSDAATNIDPLDGLRGYACLLVVLGHAGNAGLFYSIPGAGQLGVMLFFSLSGFLMEFLYGRAAFGLAKLRSFAIRRFMRVYPVFVVVVLYAAYMSADRLHYFAYLMPVEELVKHLTLRGQVSILWTVAVEMKFYVLFAIAAVLVSRLRQMQARAALWLLLACIAIGTDYGKGVISVWRYLEFFLMGMAAGALYRAYSAPSAVMRSAFNLCTLLLSAAVIMSIPRLFQLLSDSPHHFWETSEVFAPLMAALVLMCAWSSSWVRVLFANPPARALGRISFSLYLIHMPCMLTVLYFMKNSPESVQATAALVFALVVSTALYLAIESPSRRIGSWMVRRFG